MQRILIIFATFLILSHAKPNGVYQQHYQYQSSSSQYKNNQLQQKTEDEGFYSQHGDLEGRQKPKVDGYTSHLTYTNPKSTNANDESHDLTQQTEDVFDTKGMKLQQGSNHGSSYGSSHFGQGNRGYSQHSGAQDNADSLNYGTSGRQSSYSYSNSYSSSSGNVGSLNTGKTYGVDSDLNNLAQKLQSNLGSQIQDAVTNQHKQSSYSHSYSSSNTQMNDDLQRLQEELNRNLTQQLQSELQNKYGTQGKRGSYSYTISTGGQYRPSANYDNQELDDLTKQLQANLQKQLQQQVQNEYNTNSGTRTVYTTRTYGANSNLADVSKQLEDDLSKQLQNAVRNQHISSSYSHTYSSNSAQMNADLEKLKEELKRNLTQQLQDQLEKTGGSRGTYSYTITTNGKQGAVNIDNQQLADLKRQLESNLLNQLEKDVRTEYSQSSSTSGTYNTQTGGNQNAGRYVPYNPDSRYQPSHHDSQFRTTGTRVTYVTKPVTTLNENSHRTNYQGGSNIYKSSVDEDSQSNLQISGNHRTSYGTVDENDSYEQTTDSYSKPYNNRYNTGSTRLTTNTESSNTHVYSTSRIPRPNFDNQQGQNIYDSQRPLYNFNSKPASTTEDIETFLDNSTPLNTYTGGFRSHLQNPDTDDTQQVIIEPDFGPNYRPVNTGHSHTTTTSNQQSSTRIYRPIVSPIVTLPNVVKNVENDIKNEITTTYIQEQIRLWKQKHNIGERDNIDFNVIQREITNNLKNKINKKITEELQKNYGNQVQYGSYSYSQPTDNSQTPVTANYKLGDLDDLKEQVEINVNRKLTDSLKQEEKRYSEQHYSTSYQSSYQTQVNQPQFSKYGTFGEDSTTNLQSGTSNRRPSYGGSHGSTQYSTSYSTNGQYGDIDSQLSTIRADLQKQFQQQIQDAMIKQQYSSSSHSSSSQTQQYDQANLNNLQEELRRNFTQQLQDTLQKKYGRQGQIGTISYSITSSNPNFNYNQKLADFTKQVEGDLTKQLHEGLSQNGYRQDSSYSSTNYKPVIYSNPSQSSSSYGSRTYGSYSSSSSLGNHQQVMDPDCMSDEATNQDSENLNSKHTTQQLINNEQINFKPSNKNTQKDEQLTGQQIIEDDLTQKTTGVNTFQSLTTQQQSIRSSNQQTINSNAKPNVDQPIHTLFDLRQQTVDLGRHTVDLEQPTSTGDLTQKTTGVNTFESLPKQQQTTNSQRTNAKQNEDQQIHTLFDLRQKTVDLRQQTMDLGQQTRDLGQQTVDLGQQTMDLGQQTVDLGQQTDELGQQTEDIDYSDLTQQTEDDFGKLEFGGLSQQNKQTSDQFQLGQKTVDDDDDAELTQQTEDVFGKFEQIHQQPQHQLHQDLRTTRKPKTGQTPVDSSEENFGQLHLSSDDLSDLNQKTVQESYHSSSSQHSSYSYQNSNGQHPLQTAVETTDDISDDVETTTAKLGFWKRIGSKIESSYNTAKDKAKSIFSSN